MKKISFATFCILLIAVSFWAGNRFGTKSTSGIDTQPEREVLYYVDPMTPGFRSDSPGTAPCGMPLEPVYADADGGAQDLPPGAVKVNPGKQQLIGVKLATVNSKTITHLLRLYGQIVPDETRVYQINSAVESWVRELSDVTTGSYVQKDQILADILSPKFYNAQVSYLLALNNMDRMRQQLGGELRHQQGEIANNQIRNSVQSLQNLGITDAQVEELAKTRKAQPYLQLRAPAQGFVLNRNISLNQWYPAGEEFYTIVDLGKVWVYADVYENEAQYMYPGTSVQVINEHLGKTYDAKVSEVLPLFDPVSKTLKVRIDIDNPDFELRPDMFVDILVPISLPASLYVSSDAIINTGLKEILYVDMGDGVFEPRVVETGRKLGKWVEIVQGLMPDETIVASGNFLIDSESRMKTAGAEPVGKGHKDPVCGMDVDEEAAIAAGRVLVLGDKTYYFCTMGCLENFHKNPEAYLGKNPMKSGDHEQTYHHDIEEKTPLFAIDPVCMMQVDPSKAKEAGLAVTIDGVTYYFCAHRCMREFNAHQEKYATQIPPLNQTRESMQQSESDVKQHDMKGPNQENKEAPHKAKSSHSDETASGMRSYTEGEVDWDAPYNKDNDGPMDWPKGWGKFPGSKYLGMSDEKDDDAAGQNKTTDNGDEEHNHHHTNPGTISLPENPPNEVNTRD